MQCQEIRLNVVYLGFTFYLTAVDETVPLIQNEENPPEDGMFGSLLAREHSTTHL